MSYFFYLEEKSVRRGLYQGSSKEKKPRNYSQSLKLWSRLGFGS